MQTSITQDRDFELFRNLPRDIAINVFSRLTIESIMVCKVVCKEWRELIKSQEFGNYQPQRYRRLIVFRHTDVFPSSEHKQIYSASYEIKESNNNPLPIIHMGLSDSVPLVRSSVNGLILLLSRQWTEQQQHLLLWICNPITREYVKIPNPCEKEFRLGLPYPPVYRRYSFPVNTCSVEPGAPPREYGNYNFGFGVSASMQYKVVWISQSECRVYTLGTTGQWRSIAVSGAGLRYNKWNTECAFMDGNLYWLDPPESKTQSEISCFDLETEVFTYFSAPPTREDIHFDCYRSLCVFDDSLCLCDVYGSNGIEIWLRKRRHGDWNKKLVINEHEGLIGNGAFRYGYLFPIKVLEDGGNGNGLLLGDRSRDLIKHFYSNDNDGGGTGTIKHFYPSRRFGMARLEYPNAAIYTPSFLPLRTLFADEDVGSF